MGLNPLPCSVNVVHRRVALGDLPGRRGHCQRRVGQGQLVAAPRSERGADGGEGDRDVRQLVAGQGRGAQRGLRRGHPARTERRGERVHGRERLHRARRRPRHPDRFRRRRAGGHHPELHRDHRPRPGLRGAPRARDPDRPLPGRRGVPHRHGGRGGPDPRRRRPAGRHRPAPGPSPRRSSRPTSPPCGARSTATRTGSTMSTDERSGENAAPNGAERAHSHAGVDHSHAHGHRAHSHDFVVPELPESVEIFDTILRDGSQQEGLSLTVDDKLRVAEQLDHLGRDVHRRGLARSESEGRRILRTGEDRAEARHGHAGGVRLDPEGRGGGPRTTPSSPTSIDAGAPVACIVAKAWDRHVAEALRTSLDEAVAMVTDSVRLPAGARPEGLPRCRALLRRLCAQSRVRPVRARRR